MKINIPTPCHENWNAMQPNRLGRHCQVCEKTVVDFTKMTSDEIEAYFKQDTGKTCGRFNKKQLIPNTQTTYNINWWSKAKAAVLGGIISLIGINQASGQTDQKAVIHPHLGPAPENFQLLGEVERKGFTISGSVKDKETGEPLPFANVFIENTNIGTVTDFDGNFDFKAGKDTLVNNNITLIVSYIGYKEQRIENLPIHQAPYAIKIEMMMDIQILGMIGIISIDKNPADIESSSSKTTFTGKMLDMLLRR